MVKQAGALQDPEKENYPKDDFGAKHQGLVSWS